jgi:UDP-N-acetylmuramate--alanine ligase
MPEEQLRKNSIVDSNAWQERLSGADSSLHVHLIGIAGAGLSAIAQVLLEMGMQVSGSDRQQNKRTRRLQEEGARIFKSQTADNLALAGSPDLILISSAVAEENEERQAAEAQGIPTVKRAAFLQALLAERQVIAVAGTHGKTTTSAMIVRILREMGIEAGYIVGAEMAGYGNAAAGQSPIFVVEADEYDYMFLGLRPTVAVITNVEWDHPDCFPTPDSFRQAFERFVDGVKPDGLVVSCADDQGAEAVRAYGQLHGPQWITYGLGDRADLHPINLQAMAGRGYEANLIWWNAPAGRLALQTPGRHNLSNALAALVACSWCDVPLQSSATALSGFTGTARRFELKGYEAGVTVIDDYAHHPTEVEATLAAAHRRYPGQRIWAIFQPHTYSRTRRMLYRMGDSLHQADMAIVTDIFAARERDEGHVSAAELVAASEHKSMVHIGDLDEAALYLSKHVQPDDVVITMGAGDGYRVGELLLDYLREDRG